LPLPSDLPTARAQWRLRWRARRGPLSFLLPVAAGSAGSELPAERALAAALRRDPLAPLALAGIRLEDAGETLVLHLPSWRTPRQDARSLHACVAFTGAVGLVALAFDAVLAVMIAPFLIQAWHAALRNALWRARIVLQRSGIEVEAGWLRPAASALALSADLAAEVEGALSLSDRAHVRLRGAGGGAVELARGLPRAAAECLAVLLEAYLRRRRPPAPVRADAARNAQSTNN
ncbi:MAG: hypothetical protein N3B15_09435, partial [Planctomycetota bacterium]|nr:hypothetical protein [Planctomycetota bacterium]